MVTTENAVHAPLSDGEQATIARPRVGFRAQRAAREMEAGTVWISMCALEEHSGYDAVSPQ